MADKITQQYNYGRLAYLVAIAPAGVGIWASRALNVVLALFLAIPAHYASKAVPARKSTQGGQHLTPQAGGWILI